MAPSPSPIPNILILNGAPVAGAAPPISTFLASTSGAYTTTRTHSAATLLIFYHRHLRRLAHSARLLALRPPDHIDSLLRSSLRPALTLALQHPIPSELAVTALITASSDVYVHVAPYTPTPFGAEGGRLAVAGPGRQRAQAKYSDWARIRTGLERMRPPGATELLLSDDGDRILEGSLTNFFVVCRKGEFSFEVQTAPISDGVLPGVIRQLVIEICSNKGIPLREVAPSWSEHELWTEAFVTSSLRLVQHVETIEVPLSYTEMQLRTWKDVSWSTKRFEAAGIITAQIESELQERALSGGYPINDMLQERALSGGYPINDVL